MNYHKNEQRLALGRRKARLTAALANAENTKAQYKGCGVWERFFETRIINLKQALYETNLALSEFEPQFVGMTDDSDDAMAIYAGARI